MHIQDGSAQGRILVSREPAQEQLKPRLWGWNPEMFFPWIEQHGFWTMPNGLKFRLSSAAGCKDFEDKRE